MGGSSDPSAHSPARTDFIADTRAWHEARIKRLTAEDGWLTLVGLHWLKEGTNRFGSASANEVVFPATAPSLVGTFFRRGSAVSVTIEPGQTLQMNGKPFQGGILRSDAEGSPDVLELGRLHFYVIKRGDKIGIRVKDPQSEARRNFHGIETYPPSASWRLEARFEPAPAPRTLAIPNVLGAVEEMPSPGTAVFSWNGAEYRLDPVVEPGSDKLFFVFADATNRTETYGAGRFLYADMPRDGKVTLDFNRAYNPPCAFSAFATCPLPPRQNRLPVRVEAGEKRYGSH